ncbi:hypothetical protein [Chenggangzhangella methanolivorans]|uniref:Uncharacterized protein n=1 Tax=Chenggangzhangella methanolivorans TaxID=1437009 RepID=A0A9E6RC41_9HYPH|nr:hypothetical protein [Chenggangzhangella methanolivorans]QZO02066.1 hypothetical protein K6K41_12800 [Chenggangzhangella methanolivorans]
MMAATQNRTELLPDAKLTELTVEHFDAAARISDRRCFQLHVVCEVRTAEDTRALVMPWVLCDREASGQLALPHLTVPHVIAFHPIEGGDLADLRQRMMWLRLADILCGETYAPRKSRSLLETFVKLHGLSSAPVDSAVEWRDRWTATGRHMSQLFEIIAENGAPVR